MPQNMNSVLSYVFLFILFYLTYVAYDWRNKIWCSYRRRDRTKIERWTKSNKKGQWGDVEFEGGLYHVEPGRTTLIWKMVLGFFPMPARSLDFRHDSARALDPDTFENSFTAEARKELDTTDEVRAMSEGHQKALGSKKKGGFLADYMPIIMLIGFVALGFMIFQLIKAVNFNSQVLQQWMTNHP